MKTIGLILMFSAIAAFGFLSAENYYSILKGIKRADFLLKNIVLGIESENMTLEQIFEFSKKHSDEKTIDFLEKTTPQKFEKVSEISLSTGFCKDKTVNLILNEAFLILGRYSASEQIKEIDFCRNKIQLYYEKNEKTFTEKAKLLRYSGILAGFSAVIIFI